MCVLGQNLVEFTRKFDISERKKAEEALATMLGELDGGEFDLKGIEELKTLLAGN